MATNKYIEIKPQDLNAKKHRNWTGYVTCKFMIEAMVTEGTEKGEVHKLWKSFHKRLYAKFPIMHSSAR
jgi:hypothetical protein